MKKLLSLVVSFAFLVSVFTGCGDTTESSNDTETTQVTTAVETTTLPCEHDYRGTVTREATYDNEGEMTFTCTICGDIYKESIEKLVREMLPTEVLDAALSDVRYNMSPFSITIGRLVNAAIDNYKIKYLTGEEAIDSGYLSETQFDSSVDIHNVYYAIISGDTMINPDIPYMTEYESEAVKAYMIFDDDGVFQEAGVMLCENLQTCAILIMSTSY